MLIKLSGQHLRARSGDRRLLGSKRLDDTRVEIVIDKIDGDSPTEVEISTAVKCIRDSFGLHFGQHSRQTHGRAAAIY